jgi:hypothetical protein
MLEPRAEPTWTIGPSRPGRAAGADAQRRGDDLGGGHPGPDTPAPDNQGLHDLGNAVPLGLFGKQDQWTDKQAADDRYDEVNEIAERGKQVAGSVS